MKKEVKDRAILSAAENEILAKGFQGAAMEVIAKSAGVSKATLYKYYPTKTLLFETLVTSLFDKVEQTLEVPYSIETSVEDLLSTAVDMKLNLLKDQQFLKVCRILVIEKIKSNEADEDFNRKFYESYNWIISLMEKCQSDKKLSRDNSPIYLANVFHHIIDGIVFWPLMLSVKNNISIEDTKECHQTIKKVFLNSFITTEKLDREN